MSNSKTILTWLLLCLASAGVTVAVVKAVGPQIGLQQRVAGFGK
jgi:hypothetical protein